MKAGLFMKFSEFPYQRPNIQKTLDEFTEIRGKIINARNAETQIQAYYDFCSLCDGFDTACSIARIRHTVNTEDTFYTGENDFYDQSSPMVLDKKLDIYREMQNSGFKAELEAHFGPLLFSKMEIDVKSSDPGILSLLQEENALVSEYESLYASAKIGFDGKELNISQLGPYKESPDRTVRKAAFAAEGTFFDENRAQFDDIFDRLVQNRTAQAVFLGYENYVPLGYIRMKRNGYGRREVEAYRRQVELELVPVVAEIKALQAKRIGVTDDFNFYDNDYFFSGKNPVPKGTPEEILESGKRMYHALSTDTAGFIDFMMDRELFDVLSKKGKAPGGYCTYIPDHKSPFIFSNFNGTSGDVDVLTHEAGHAFAAYQASKQNLIPEYQDPTLESCEIHSMSMEYLTGDYHHLFFGEDTGKYQLSHAESDIAFLPYGCMVDEFQHLIYQQPRLTPDQRNNIWLELEHKYRPYIDFDNLPFYSRGAGWQRQIHIYESPFYYIDYCLAQTVAFQFWMAWLEEPKDAWRRYLDLVNLAGTKTYTELVEAAGFQSPFFPGCLTELAPKLLKWVKEHQVE